MGIFKKMNLTLHSGAKSDFKIECDALDDEDIETIAYLISKKVNFRKVIGVPNGGIRLQKSLEKYITDGLILIVDDVLTTGKSMEEMRNKEGKETIGVVIFARNKCPDWITPIFQMWG